MEETLKKIHNHTKKANDSEDELFSDYGEKHLESKAQISALENHFEKLLKTMKADESTAIFAVELRTLLNKYMASYYLQRKLIRKIKEYKAELTTATERNHSLAENLQKAKDEVETLKRRGEQLHAVAEEASKERDDAISHAVSIKAAWNESDIMHERNLVQKLQEELDHFSRMHEHEMNELRTEIEQINEEKLATERRLGTTTSSLLFLEQEMIPLKEDLENEKRRRARVDKDVMLFRVELQEKRNELAELAKVSAKWHSEAEEHKARCANAEETCRAYKRKTLKLASRMETLASEHTMQSNRIMRLVAEKEFLTKSLKDNEEKLRAMNVQMSHLRKANDGLESRILSLEHYMKEAEKVDKSRKMELDLYKKRTEELSEQLAKTTREFEEHRNLRKAADDRIAQLSYRITELQSIIDLRNKDLTEANKEISQAREQIKKDEAKILNLKLQNTSSLQKIKNHSASILELRNKERALDQKISLYVAEVEELNLSAKKQVAKSQILEEEKVKLEAKLGELSKELNKEKEKYEECLLYERRLRKQIQDQQTEIIQLKVNSKRSKSLNISHENTIKKLKEIINNTKSEVRGKQDRISNLEKDIAALTSSLAQLQRSVHITKAQNKHLTTQLCSKDREVHLLNEKIRLMDQIATRVDKAYKIKLQDNYLLKNQLAKCTATVGCLERKAKLCAELKQEVCALEKGSTEEKLKVKVLEMEMTSRRKIHNLRETALREPDTLELLQKNKFLQGSLMSKVEQLKKKDAEIQENLTTIKHLKSRLNPQNLNTQTLLLTYRSKCRKQQERIDRLSAEVSMYLQCCDHLRDEISKMRQQCSELQIHAKHK